MKTLSERAADAEKDGKFRQAARLWNAARGEMDSGRAPVDYLTDVTKATKRRLVELGRR